MNPTPVLPKSSNPRGWIYFDDTCPFCVGQRQRWGDVFARRGFTWVPLQTPGTAARLGVSEEQLQQEMWLELATGQVFGGLDAWIVLLRSVWWLRPLGCGLGWPGFYALGRRFYRWIAQRRHCLSGGCQLPRPSSRAEPPGPSAPAIHRHAAFLELP